MITLLSLCCSIVLGMMCSRYAEQRGRRPQVWFYIGLFFGITGLITLFLLPRVGSTEPDRSGTKECTPAEPKEQEPDPRFQHWFFVDQSRTRQGPVPFRRLFTAWRDQLISQESLVWTEGMPQWEPISKLPTLLDKLN